MTRSARANPGDPPPAFPQIIGTGFVVDSRGIVVTNRHVAEAMMALPPHPTTGEPSAMAFVCHEVRRGGLRDSMGMAVLGVRHYVLLTEFTWTDEYYGDPLPDIAVVQVGATNLPPLRLVTSPGSWEVGTRIATAGYALGRSGLVVYNRLNQVTPFLRTGVISSVYPFPTDRPHGFTIDVMSQGGQSGSPIFSQDAPDVLGLLHAGFDGTNITMAVPSHLVSAVLGRMLTKERLDFDGVPTIEEICAKGSKNAGLSWRKGQ